MATQPDASNQTAGSKSPPDNAAVDAATGGAGASTTALDNVDDLKKRNADLTADLGAVTGERDDLKQQAESLQQQLGNATSERDQVAQQLSGVRGDLEQAAKDRDAAQAKVSALENASSVESIAQGRKLRTTKVLTIDPTDGDAQKAFLAELAEATQGECEIVFSDGKREIRGIDPVRVSGPVWQRIPAGLLLTQPIDVSGPPTGVSPYEIAGFALFDDEGDQIAWSALPEPIRVMPNGRTQIRQSIIF